MLRPLAIQAALNGLLALRSSPADVALVVLSDSGTLYAQSHLLDENAKDSTVGSSPEAKPGHIDGMQRAHQPGLTALMPIQAGGATGESGAGSTSSPMLISLTPDERARVLAGSACQAWTEEVARVRRLRTSASGRFAGMAASRAPSVTSGGSSGTGLRNASGFPPPMTKLHPTGDESVEAGSASPALALTESEEEDEKAETTAVPVAILGTPLPTTTAEGTAPDVAPLLLESELGAMLVLPLLPQGAHLTTGTNGTGSVNDTNTSVVRPPMSHAALLLVLSAAAPATSPSATTTTHVDALQRGNSSLTQEEWNAMHDAAQSFATFIAPALRKAFGRSGELLSDDHPGGGAGAIGGGADGAGGNGGGATTIFSDDRESTASVEASQMLGQAGAQQSASQISVP